MGIKNLNNLLVFIFSGIYLFFLAYFVSEEKYLILTFPILFSLFFLSIFNFKYIFYLIICLTPLSISLSDLGIFVIDIEMAFPTEPILFGLMLLTIFKIGYQFQLFKSVFKHPISCCILLYLLWMLITCITSSMPLISFKVFLTRLWYIIPIYRSRYCNNIYI